MDANKQMRLTVGLLLLVVALSVLWGVVSSDIALYRQYDAEAERGRQLHQELLER